MAERIWSRIRPPAKQGVTLAQDRPALSKVRPTLEKGTVAAEWVSDRLPSMLFQDLRARLGKFTVPIQRIFQYNVSNWIREMPRSPFLHRWTYDSISGDNAEDRLRNALADASGSTMQILKSLVDPQFNEDDVTILLVKRDADAGSLGRLG